MSCWDSAVSTPLRSQLGWAEQWPLHCLLRHEGIRPRLARWPLAEAHRIKYAAWTYADHSVLENRNFLVSFEQVEAQRLPITVGIPQSSYLMDDIPTLKGNLGMKSSCGWIRIWSSHGRPADAAPSQRPTDVFGQVSHSRQRRQDDSHPPAHCAAASQVSRSIGKVGDLRAPSGRP